MCTRPPPSERTEKEACVRIKKNGTTRTAFVLAFARVLLVLLGARSRRRVAHAASPRRAGLSRREWLTPEGVVKEVAKRPLPVVALPCEPGSSPRVEAKQPL